MTTKSKFGGKSARLLGIIATCIFAWPAHSGSPPEVSVKNLDKLTWAKATVTGASENLKLFDANLRTTLGFQDLESHMMGCVEGCDGLNSMNPPAKIIYVFPRENPDFLKRFAKAWDTTQAASKDPGLTIRFELGDSPPDCTGPTNPAPCQSVPFCAIDYCGRKANNKIDCNAC